MKSSPVDSQVYKKGPQSAHPLISLKFQRKPVADGIAGLKSVALRSAEAAQKRLPRIRADERGWEPLGARREGSTGAGRTGIGINIAPFSFQKNLYCKLEVPEDTAIT
jgi:hypothetical protein